MFLSIVVHLAVTLSVIGLSWWLWSDDDQVAPKLAASGTSGGGPEAPQ